MREANETKITSRAQSEKMKRRMKLYVVCAELSAIGRLKG